jgi:hypothetical protein
VIGIVTGVMSGRERDFVRHSLVWYVPAIGCSEKRDDVVVVMFFWILLLSSSHHNIIYRRFSHARFVRDHGANNNNIRAIFGAKYCTYRQ